MKLSAITSRSAQKDYVDLYFILQQISLKELLAFYKTKYSDDTAVVVKSLVFFDDIEVEAIIYKENNETNFAEIRKFIKQQVSGVY